MTRTATTEPVGIGRTLASPRDGIGTSIEPNGPGEIAAAPPKLPLFELGVGCIAVGALTGAASLLLGGRARNLLRFTGAALGAIGGVQLLASQLQGSGDVRASYGPTRPLPAAGTDTTNVPARRDLGGISASRAPLDPIMARVFESAVAVATETNIIGSGWVVADDVVVTNAHVAAGRNDEGKMNVRDADGEIRRATLIGLDPGNDLALLHVPGLDRAAIPVDDVVDAGEQVAVFGYPGRESLFTLTTGETLRIRTAEYVRDGQRWTVDLVEATADVEGGNSGGVVVNGAGEAVGTVTRGGDGSTQAVPIGELQALLDANGIEPGGTYSPPA